MNADTDSVFEESVKVIQGRVAHGTLYVHLTCPTMDNRHNKLSQVFLVSVIASVPQCVLLRREPD